MTIDNYIKNHDAVNYCEAIVFPNGDIEDAIPGHTYKLMSITNKSYDEINKLMPESAAPLDWLLGYTECIAIWYDFFRYDSITDAQLESLKKLMLCRILREEVTGYSTDEYKRTALLEKLKDGEDVDLEKLRCRNEKIFMIRKGENVWTKKIQY